MRRIDVELLSGSQALDAFSASYRAAEAGVVSSRLVFGSLREFYLAITDDRLALIRFVATHRGCKIDRIASGLGRPTQSVHSDLEALLDLGLLEKAQGGELIAPFDEIRIHGRITDA